MTSMTDTRPACNVVSLTHVVGGIIIHQQPHFISWQNDRRLMFAPTARIVKAYITIAIRARLELNSTSLVMHIPAQFVYFLQASAPSTAGCLRQYRSTFKKMTLFVFFFLSKHECSSNRVESSSTRMRSYSNSKCDVRFRFRSTYKYTQQFPTLTFIGVPSST